MVRLALIFLLAAASLAHAQTQAELLGPQFEFGWTAPEQETVVKALRKLETCWNPELHAFGSPARCGIDDYLMARQKRIIATIEDGFVFYDQHWKEIKPFVLRGADGQPWSIIHFSLPMTILSSFAVSRDRYCRREDEDMDEETGRAYCADANSRAIALWEHSFAHVRHIVPGGARP